MIFCFSAQNRSLEHTSKRIYFAFLFFYFFMQVIEKSNWEKWSAIRNIIFKYIAGTKGVDNDE